MIRPDHAERTDAGRQRPGNEDALLTLCPDEPARLERTGALFAVADGLGGLADGEVASRTAVECVREQFGLLESFCSPSWLKQVIAEANGRLYQTNRRRPTPERMATTLTLSFFFGDRLYIAHAGDCRVYRVKGGRIQALTVDHAAGRNYLTRALGLEERIEVDLYDHKIAPGEVFVQCSDGLYTMVDDERIGLEAVSGTPQQACDRLVELANAAGGTDNISVQIMRISRDGSSR